MSSGQKIIKILATIFAVFLAISIIGSIVAAIFFGLALDSHTDTHIETQLSDDSENGGSTMETYNFSESYIGVTSLDIEATINNVILLPGDNFTVTMENVSTYCKVTQDEGELKIHDTSHSGRSFLSWIADALDGKGFSSLKGGTITVTYPSDFMANTCDIQAGTGTVSIQDLNAMELNIEAGTGSIEGSNITANYMDLEAGTGSADFKNCTFQGTDIEAGTGSISITGTMKGQNSIECGVGSVYLALTDPQDAYYMDVEKGLGSITIDGSSYSSVKSNSPSSSNALSIEGGVGNVTIDFAKQF